MPRFPTPATTATALRESSFGALLPIIARRRKEGELFPFHLGDTHLLPASEARRISLDRAEVHRYCPVRGMPQYLESVASWVGPQVDVPFTSANVVATTGCTGGLSAIAAAVFDPGDEVLVITPVWPLILGILSSRGAVPVQVPIGDSGWPNADVEAFRGRLEAACSERTTGLYLCDPNNPGGFVTPPEHLEAIRDLAAERDLWTVADTVYKDLIFDAGTWNIRTLTEGDARNRTILVGSFSKSHALAGHRAGFILAPDSLESVFTRVVTHSVYNAPTSAQEMAVAALAAGPREIARVRASYAEGLDAACSGLDARFARPQAGGFLFLDLRDRVADEHQCMELLTACAEAGVALAPGEIFGAHWGRFARLCYSVTPAATVREGIRRLNEVLAGW